MYFDKDALVDCVIFLDSAPLDWLCIVHKPAGSPWTITAFTREHAGMTVSRRSMSLEPGPGDRPDGLRLVALTTAKGTASTLRGLGLGGANIDFLDIQGTGPEAFDAVSLMPWAEVKSVTEEASGSSEAPAAQPASFIVDLGKPAGAGGMSN